ncbi:MAG: hypothetical protein WBQ16_13090 [Nitrososphaeraceae archaeon]
MSEKHIDLKKNKFVLKSENKEILAKEYKKKNVYIVSSRPEDHRCCEENKIGGNDTHTVSHCS